MRELLRAARFIAVTMFEADRRSTFAMVGLSLAGILIFNVYAILLKLVTDSIIRGDPGTAFVAAVGIAIEMAIVPLDWSGSAAVGMTLTERTVHLVERRLTLLALSNPGLELHERPEYLDRLTALRSQAREIGNTWPLLGFAGSLVGCVANLAILTSLDLRLLVLPLFVAPSLLIAADSERRIVAAEATVASSQRLRARLFELLTTPGPAKELRIFGTLGVLSRRHRTEWQATNRTLDRARLNALLRTVLGWSIFAAGLVIGVLIVVSRRQASAGDALLFVVIAQSLEYQIGSALRDGAALTRSLAVAGQFLAFQDSIRVGRAALPPSGPAISVVPVPDAHQSVPERLCRGVELEEVCFRYPGSPRLVLDHVSLALPAGSTVALVGENGAGKTSLVKLLAGFYRPTEGRVVVDGTDLGAFEPTGWRARLSGCFQDFTRLELLARESVGVGDLALIDDVAVVRGALATAGGASLERRLPRGLETQLGRAWDGGVDLSLGQWQKVALGRGFMRAPLLLMLDEPTASLDAETEYRLFGRYAAAARDRKASGSITVLVSHRFSTVQMADLIVVLDSGRVVETGTHRELMRREGPYAELYSIQARGYRH